MRAHTILLLNIFFEIIHQHYFNTLCLTHSHSPQTAALIKKCIPLQNCPLIFCFNFFFNKSYERLGQVRRFEIFWTSHSYSKNILGKSGYIALMWRTGPWIFFRTYFILFSTFYSHILYCIINVVWWTLCNNSGMFVVK